MAFISDDEINNIKNNVDIVNLIASYLPLSQKGKNYFGVCPFHEDHSPSMSVSKDKQIYKCFSCGASGNIFTFVQNYENISFPEAVTKVAEFAGITLNNTFKKTESKYDEEYKIMDLSLLFYENNLNTQFGLDAIKYLDKRKIDKDAIKEFNIGLSPDNPDQFYQLLKNKNLNIDIAKKIGLINELNGRCFDTFTKRIMFPIHNVFGQVIGYTGRIYKTDSQNKYMNSRENVIFRKGNILFNYHRAKDYIKRQKELIIVEGNLDAIRLSIEGVKNVVALMGTALTKEQIEIIKKLRVKTILAFDNDDAGELATITNGELLQKENVDLGVVRLSGEKDPDSYVIKNGIEAFKENVKNSINFIDFKMFYLKKSVNLNKTEDLRKYIKELISSLKDSNDEILVEISLNKISTEYHLDIDLLKREYASLKEKSVPKEVKEEIIKVDKKKSKYDYLIKNILYYMMNDIKYVKGFKTRLGYIKTKELRELSNDIIYYADKNKSIDLASFLTYIALENSSVTLVDDIIRACPYIEFNESLFIEYISLVKKEIVNTQIKEIKAQMKNELDENIKLEMLKKLTELKKEV